MDRSIRTTAQSPDALTIDSDPMKGLLGAFINASLEGMSGSGSEDIADLPILGVDGLTYQNTNLFHFFGDQYLIKKIVLIRIIENDVVINGCYLNCLVSFFRCFT